MINIVFPVEMIIPSILYKVLHAVSSFSLGSPNIMKYKHNTITHAIIKGNPTKPVMSAAHVP